MLASFSKTRSCLFKIWETSGNFEFECAATFFTLEFFRRSLSDVNHDGRLDLTEFCYAMHLSVARRHGLPIPTELPASLRSSTKSVVNAAVQSIGAEKIPEKATNQTEVNIIVLSNHRNSLIDFVLVDTVWGIAENSRADAIPNFC